MFAIIETGGKQYKIEKGTTFEIEKLEGKEGESITIDKVLLISDKDRLKIGTPLIEGASVTAKVVGHKKGIKVLIYKMHAKHRYQKTKGHRQNLTTVEITDIKEHGTVAKEAPKKEVAKKTPVKKPTVKKPSVKKAKAAVI